MKLKTVFGILVLLAASAAASAKDVFSCSTELATEITMTTAKINGTAVFKKVSDVGYGHFYISEFASEAGELKSAGARYAAGNIPVEGGWFSVYLTGLKPGTTYYYMASVIVGGKEKFGEVNSFYTPEKPTRICFTGDVSDVTVSSARLSGNAFVFPELGTVSIGFIISEDGNPSFENGKVVLTKEMDYDNVFSATATELNPGTTYFYKAFLESQGICRSGEVQSFTTPSFSASTKTLDASEVEFTSARLNASMELSGTAADVNVSGCYFMLAEKSSMVGAKRIDAAAGMEFSASVNNLKPDSEYYFRAVATIHGKEFRGDILSFKTSVPEVFTADPVKVESFSVTLSGNFSFADGGSCGVIMDACGDPGNLIPSGFREWCRSGEKGDDSFEITISGLMPCTEYFFAAVNCVGGKEYFGEVKSFTTGAWPEYVDMGDGLEWYSWNLGASSPEENGDYYAWGEVKVKSSYDWAGYKWNTVNWGDSFTKYCFDSTYGNNGFSDSKIVLEKADDAASAGLGAGWRIPTREEWENLIGTDGWWEYNNVVNYKGVAGIYIVSRETGQGIFLPKAGYRNGPALLQEGRSFSYWSSSLSTASVSKAETPSGPMDRNQGLCIRPVRSKNK